MGPSTESYIAAILNAAWLVRHYSRGIRLESHRAKRAEAIDKLGVIVENAFKNSKDYESILTAVVDGLSPRPPSF